MSDPSPAYEPRDTMDDLGYGRKNAESTAKLIAISKAEAAAAAAIASAKNPVNSDHLGPKTPEDHIAAARQTLSDIAARKSNPNSENKN